ncbi:MAG: helix-turn-helix transcriptional regulator [Vicinamibacterales bacterium]
MPPLLQLHWFHILLALADKPLNGAGITEEVLERTEGGLQLWPGMLYGALKKMTDLGYVVDTDVPNGFSTGGGKPRFYRITALGKRVCAAEAARMDRIVTAARDKRLLRNTRA